MARARHVLVLALVMFAIIGLARAAEAPAANEADYEEDDNEFMIGVKGAGGNSAPAPGTIVAAPLGGPVPPGAFSDAKAPAPSAAASLTHMSAVAGAATAALVAGFF